MQWFLPLELHQIVFPCETASGLHLSLSKKCILSLLWELPLKETGLSVNSVASMDNIAWERTMPSMILVIGTSCQCQSDLREIINGQLADIFGWSSSVRIKLYSSNFHPWLRSVQSRKIMKLSIEIIWQKQTTLYTFMLIAYGNRFSLQN